MLIAERTEHAVLSLYGLTAATFIQQQRQMDVNIVSQLDNAMQVYASKINAQSLIVGFDPDNSAHIYYVDNDGIAHCMDDMGFACIGIGKDHSNAQFASHGYSNAWPYYQALALVYGAKKSAEIAPGVGLTEDMHQITRERTFRIHDEMRKALEQLYKRYRRQLMNMEKRLVEQLIKRERDAAARETSAKADASEVSTDQASWESPPSEAQPS